MFSVLILLVVPLGCWLVVARTRRWRLIGAGVLLAAVLIGFVLSFFQLPGDLAYGLVAGYVLVATLAVVAGMIVERRAAELPAVSRRSRVAALLAVLFLVVYALVGLPLVGLSWRFAAAGPALPDQSLISPLPDGVTVHSEVGTGCGTGGCETLLTFDGSPETVDGKLREGLAGQDLKLDDHGWGCRPHPIWPERQLCAQLSTENGRAALVLSDNLAR
ncbi:hypothetical protein D5S17_31490 [Pseudonocardiaceae bacterium YIM PH 21723]|nr:hypothetical protein D5S17_31490 [Pseudonocardiaceae bacterium YIM PH 21723]